MKKIILALLLLLPFPSLFAQTYYYKIAQQTENTTKQLQGGQYITFTHSTYDKTCYESDSEGFSVKNGVMMLVKSQNGSDLYEGTCYWGRGTVYMVNSDKSKINVTSPQGGKYVYTRTTAPASQQTCSLISGRSSAIAGDGNLASNTAPNVNPTPQNNGTFDNGGNSGRTTSNTQQTEPKPKRKTWRNVTRVVDCPMCHHTGKCQTCNGKGWYYNPVGPGTLNCPNCMGYKTGKCSKCQGTGTIEKIEQVYE